MVPPTSKPIFDEELEADHIRKAGRFRWSIRKGMILIAALAGLFGVFGVVGGIGVLLGVLIVTGPVAYARRGRRYEALSWVATGFPVVFKLSLVATWLTAWSVLGHRPVPLVDDPKDIGPLVDVPFAATAFLMLMLFPSFVVCLWLAVLRAIGRLDVGSSPDLRVAKAFLQPALWIGGLLCRGPVGETLGEIGAWFMD